MPDLAPALVRLIKKAAVEAVERDGPCAILFGTVTAEKPLEICVEQKLTLKEKALILTTLVQDFEAEMTVEHKTESTGGGTGEAAFSIHNHGYRGRKKFLLHLGLKTGEKVILLRVQGGKKYVVLDRVR